MGHMGGLQWGPVAQLRHRDVPHAIDEDEGDPLSLPSPHKPGYCKLFAFTM